MWPKNSLSGFRAEPVGTHCACGAPVSRGTVLSGLFGANVRLRVGPFTATHDPPGAA
jgi:hypothetical protein